MKTSRVMLADITCEVGKDPLCCRLMTRVKLAELTGVVFSPFMGELEGVRPLSLSHCKYTTFSRIFQENVKLFSKKMQVFSVSAQVPLCSILISSERRFVCVCIGLLVIGFVFLASDIKE